MSILKTAKALLQSKRFTPFFEGVTITLPEVGELTIKIKTTERSVRPQGLQFFTYSYMTEMTASNGISSVGYGEDNDSIVSLQKSISEGIERIVFRSLKNTVYGSESTNGWAVHVSKEQARLSAQFELLERDAVMVHWLTETPMIEIDPDSLPKIFQDFQSQLTSSSQSFNRLRILSSTIGHIPTVTVMLQNKTGHAVISHAAKNSMTDAIESALAEVCRITHIVNEMKDHEFATEPSTPADYITAYARHRTLPTWFFGDKEPYSTMNAIWKERVHTFLSSKSALFGFLDFKVSGLFAARCKSESVQDLFFTTTDIAMSNGKINFERLKNFGARNSVNLAPHIVP